MRFGWSNTILVYCTTRFRAKHGSITTTADGDSLIDVARLASNGWSTMGEQRSRPKSFSCSLAACTLRSELAQ